MPPDEGDVCWAWHHTSLLYIVLSRILLSMKDWNVINHWKTSHWNIYKSLQI